MARYIDADKMREEWLENGENEYVYDTNAVLDSIDMQSTADVVEVVWCKDCKYYYEGIMHRCTHECGLKAPQADAWCKYGERKEFNEKYEIIDQDGKIYTVRERE